MKNYHYIIAGSHGSGKTTALNSLKEYSFHPIQNLAAEHQALSISLNIAESEHAVIKLNASQTAFVYSYANPTKIAEILPVLGHEADGGIILLDHRQNTALDELDIYLNLLNDQVDNLIVAISHVDQDPVQLLKKYKNWLSMKNLNIPVFTVDPREKEAIKQLIEILVARSRVSETQN